MSTRTEKDVIGEVKIPEDAYYGSFTQRAKENFQISGLKANPEFIKSLALIKKSAALTNKSLGLLEEKKADAIIKAADEVIDGKLNDNFILDVFQF